MMNPGDDFTLYILGSAFESRQLQIFKGYLRYGKLEIEGI